MDSGRRERAKHAQVLRGLGFDIQACERSAQFVQRWLLDVADRVVAAIAPGRDFGMK
jgi:hypothetical protein